MFWDGYVHAMDTAVAENVEFPMDINNSRNAMKQEVTALSENSCWEMSAPEAGAGIRILFSWVKNRETPGRV